MRYNAESYSSLIYNTQHYKGINGENPPVKILTPQKHKKGVVIIFPGASPIGENHPKMLMLGQVLARSGFKVYIPRIPPLKNLDITETYAEFWGTILNCAFCSYNLLEKKSDFETFLL